MEQLKKDVYIYVQRLSLGLVWRELQVFSRLLYRGRNQHRRDKSFQRLLRVSKDLKKYQEVSLSNHVKRLWKILPGSAALSVSLLQSIEGVSTELVVCAQFTAKILGFIETTYNDVNIRLYMSLFIPFNLLMMSSLSRLWYCLRYHLQAISETYSTLINCLLPTHKISLPATVIDSLCEEHRPYLNRPDLSLSRTSLGTAVIRTDIVPSEVTHPPCDLTSRDIPHSTPLLSNMAPVNNNSLRIVDRSPIVCKTRKKVPNTIVGVVKSGRKMSSVKIRCKSYLKSQNQTCFKIRLLKLNSNGRNPWNHIGLKYKASLKPLKSKQHNHLHNVMSSDELSIIKETDSETQNSQRQCCTDLDSTEIVSDDIDDIFSALGT